MSLTASLRTVSLLGTCLAVLALAGCGGSDAAPAERLRAGALVALSGDAAPIGRAQERAMRLAVEELNERGGIHGTQLQLLVADSGTDPARAESEMRRLIADEEVVAVLGPTLSVEAVRADPVADGLRTPVLAVSNTAERIVGDCAYDCDWIWRNSVGADRTVAANVAYATSSGRPATAALLTAGPGDLLAATEARVAAATFDAAGVEVVSEVTLREPTSGEPAIAAEVANALRGRPDVLFVTASDLVLATEVFAEVRRQRFAGRLLGGDILNGASETPAAAAALRGVRSGAAWFAGNDFPANAHFVRVFRAVYDVAPDQFAAQAYSGVAILAQAIERGDANGGELSLGDRRAAVQDGLGEVALTTPLGPFRFTRDHDVDQIVWIIEANGDGGHDLVQFCDPDC
ncbi:MAG TPA: ABC transporter substrate-binding protein [Conexibacter sp.]|nr:ABC transporter substrate-binding protein [Conexibacter sp.]